MSRILFLTYDLPYPLTSGGKIRAYHLLKALFEQGNEIILISFYRKGEDFYGLDELRKYCSSIFTFRRRWVWHPFNLLLAFFTKYPLPAVSYFSTSIARFLKRYLKKENIDTVFFESFYPAVYLPLLKRRGVKVVFGNENREYLVYKRYRQNSKLFPLFPLFIFDTWKMRKFEQKLWEMADLNLAVSPEDVSEITRISGKNCWLVPNGIDYDFYSQANLKQDGRLTAIFSGNLAYMANQEAVRFFLKEIWPEIRASFKRVYFEIISKTKPRWLTPFLRDGFVKLIQDTKNPVRDYIARGDVFVAPMKIGSGTNIKILEAMATGIPVVTTKKGAEGLGTIPENVMVVTSDSRKFTFSVISIFRDREKGSRFGRAGQEFVSQNFDVIKINKKFAADFSEWLKGNK